MNQLQQTPLKSPPLVELRAIVAHARQQRQSLLAGYARSVVAALRREPRVAGEPALR